MRQVIRTALAVSATFGLLAVVSSPAAAQSGTRNTPPSGSSSRTAAPSGSGQRGQAQASLALEGYCPVSLHKMNKWVKGNPAIQSTFDGHAYNFANEEGRQMFAADPVKYAPVLGGDCVVSLVKIGKRVPGNIRQAALRDGRLFLFANADGKKMFQADPQAYDE
jgi:YHS domain-containing protein